MTRQRKTRRNSARKGRKLDVLLLCPSKESTVRTWFERNGLKQPPSIQLGLAM